MTSSRWTRRILVVEDDALFGSLLQATLDAAGYATQWVGNAAAAMAAVSTFTPDAILLDLDLGMGPTGVDVAQAVAAQEPNVAIVMLTRYSDVRAAGYPRDALPPGCTYMSKDECVDVDQLLDTISRALRGPVADSGRAGQRSSELAALTDAQLDAVRLASLGLTNAAIASRRGTSDRAVEMLLRSAAAKLGIASDDDFNRRVLVVRRYFTLTGGPTRGLG